MSVLEREILIEFEPFKYQAPKVLVRAGNEDLFSEDLVNLDKGNEADLAADPPLVFAGRETLTCTTLLLGCRLLIAVT